MLRLRTASGRPGHHCSLRSGCAPPRRLFHQSSLPRTNHEIYGRRVGAHRRSSQPSWFAASHDRSHLFVINIKRDLSYARKPRPTGSNTPTPSTQPPPPPPPIRAAPPRSTGGNPPPGFWAKVEFFREYVFAGVILLVLLVVFVWWAADRVPDTNRFRLMIFPRSVDQTLAAIAEKQLLFNEKIVDSTQQADVMLLQSIADRLAKAPGGLKMRVSVTQSSSPNAFVLPNGRCMVTTKLLDLLDRDEDMLAVVLAHESAHVRARHAAEKLSNSTLLNVMLGDTSTTTAALLLELPFSRRQEQEADHIGLLSMARVCYDPHKAVQVWERMMKFNSQPQVLSLISSHPSAADRIYNIKQLMPMADMERMAHCAKAAKQKKNT